MNDKTISILTDFYLDNKRFPVYHNRWDTWLIVHNYMDIYFYLMMKTDSQVARILEEAKGKADEIRNSPLYKVLEEEDL